MRIWLDPEKMRQYALMPSQHVAPVIAGAFLCLGQKRFRSWGEAGSRAGTRRASRCAPASEQERAALQSTYPARMCT
ncbi:hypothetical protein ACSMEB_17745, partial [Stenotrophomonas maltophilia]